MAEGYLAMYLRLSLDDVDLKTDGLKGESDSIHSQRMLMKQYISRHTDLNRLPVLEFADDGYTGTNFDRPGFQKMMDRIRSGSISCVIVKDLSRFGRNYLEVGDYLEHIFPFLNVRFIAVNDHYDSSGYIGTTGGIDVAFRNLIYQRYSQDLSEKVKSAMHMKMAKGKYVTNCPYGYRKKPGIKHEMVPDPVTAPIVQEIFKAAISGKKTTEIAVMLNERQIPTPLEYKKLTRKNMHNKAMWSHAAILRIIQDYKYTGAMVNFKCENETIRAVSQRKRKPEEWVVVENSHPAIVSHEEYEKANASIRKVKPHIAKRSDCRDRVYYCGHCGRRLRKTFGTDEYYSCTTQLYRKDMECSKIFWSRTDMEKIILASYKGQLALMREEHEKTQQDSGNPLKRNREEQKRLSEQAAGCASKNLQFYEAYKNGEYDKETFLEKKAALLEQKNILEEKLARLRTEEEALILQRAEAGKRSTLLAEAGGNLQLSDGELKEQMYDVIEKVVVCASKEIEIHWKLADCFRTVTQTKGEEISGEAIRKKL